MEARDEEIRELAVSRFVALCEASDIQYTMRHDTSIAIQELLHESIYADLLIIDSKETLCHYDENIPTRFVRDLLSEVQCPVLVVPHNYKNIDKVILLYDGEPSSVFAIRTFSILFPELNKIETEVLTVKTPDQPLYLPDKNLMKEFMIRHFPNLKFNLLKGSAEAEIIHEVKHQGRNVMLVLGAYRRGRVSRWFRQSMADVLMSHLKVPLFITHN